jgi:hypothetical protein
MSDIDSNFKKFLDENKIDVASLKGTNEEKKVLNAQETRIRQITR